MSDDIKKYNVIAVMTMPRLAFTDNMACVANMAAMGIPLIQRGGAFWGQGMTRGIQEALDKGADLILTIDYDTLFTRADVKALLGIMELRPDIDAICPLQMHRSTQSLLMSTDPKNMEIPKAFLNEPVYKIRTGHFGLTLLRAGAVFNLKKPWFFPTPDASGAWGDGRIDDDMNFWLNWEKANNTLYAATRVSVGHIVRQIKWCGQRLSEVLQPLENYAEHGKPGEAI